MTCVRPPLLKKPARGFAWSCGPCSRKQERKLEARNTPLVGERAVEGEEEEYLDEEDEEHAGVTNPINSSSPGNHDTSNGVQPATAEQIAQAKLWPFRYLGIHCKVEDVLDYDDRIYPRAISRLGPRHQANVINWHGRPLEYVKPAEMKRKYMKGSIQKKEVKIPKDTVAALEADKLAKEKRPKWVVDEPAGFVHRGGDHQNSDIANTAKICFRLPQVGEASSRGGDEAMLIRHEPRQLEQIIDDYMIRARSFAPSLGLKEHSTNFLDKALQYLYNNNFDPEAAFTQLQAVDLRKDLKEPKLSKEELKRFEEGIAKYGTNLHEVSKHVGKPPKNGEIVRFYYMWKKTDRGKQIWGNFEGRKPKKSARVLDSALVDDVADDVDDSAFDNDKATARKRGFECKFCWTRQSRLWRRAPGTAPGTTVLAESGSKGNKDKAVHLMVALCERCAGLWRRYAIQWESVDELAKKVAQSGGRAWKRKMDSELLEELFNANQASAVATSSTAVAAAASVGIHVPQTMTVQPEQEAVRKKLKTGSEKDSPQQNIHSVPPEPPKKKVVEKPPEPPLVPDPPKIKVLPCFICKEMEPSGEEHFCCRYCRLTVHRNCYGISEERSVNKWTCDMCFNDVNCLTSTSYECRLCPVQYNDYELMEPPKASHKKKTDREREKERLEKELVVEATTQYQRRQEETGRPVCPREPLKKTSGNNWVHVVCAVWTSLIKFGNAKLLEPAEGLGSIPQSRYGQTCKICKTSGGVCITCHKCPATFHVGCAHQYGYPMGFDVTPVKSSRKDVVNTVTLGNETGNVEAVIYCKDHPVKTILHPMHELVEDSGLNALQLFVRNFKQADLALTGTVRKAAIINSSVRAPQATSINGHRPSISNIAWVADGSSSLVPTTRSSGASPTAVTVKSEEVDEDGDRVVHLNESICMESFTKECVSCGTEISPKWHLKGLLKISSTEISSVDVKPTMAHPQQESSDSNGLTCTSTVNHGTFHVFNKTSDSAETASVPNGHALITQDQPKNAVLSATVNGTIHPTTTTTIKSLGPAESVPDYLCHRCYLKKLRDPTPLVSVTEPVQPLETVPPPPEEIPAVETRAASPAPWPPVSTPLPSRPESWPIQSQPQLASTIRTSNGVDHSSSFVATHVQQPYVPSPQQPPSQPHYHMNGYEHREQHHGPPVQLSMNGAPPPYHLSRNIPPPPQQAAYPVQGPGHAGVPYGRSNANGTRSPPVHYRIAQAPPGPPRAAENPFEMPHHSRDSPRQHYYGPRAEDRPATPSEANSRNGGWGGGEGPVANGASASPSLRNLLH
ncbi:putative PHD type zinc finger protein with BAH domain-containing protein [Lambiella insularis]|nr:putative PHD type zinc finger protein with BAH domain-containing protein [Lambiella insularis]